nr:DUF6134 family protein [uncultured Rhodopila sp.]
MPGLAALLIAAQFCSAPVLAEVCRFAGTTSHDGHVAVTTDVEAKDGITKVDVTMAFDATWLWFFRFRYLVEEISTWRANRMQSLAVNTRYLYDNRIVRQQWDAFERGPDGLQARRVQAKTLADFRRRHPGFVQHWDPATFGSPWLQDYQAASPERRADLDLKVLPLPEGLSSPLAMAFYWVRWLPRGTGQVPVFLPGFKADKLVHVPVTAESSGVRRASLQYPALSKTPASIATAVTSADGHLLQLAFDVHEPGESAHGTVQQEGCQGAPVKPDPGSSLR